MDVTESVLIGSNLTAEMLKTRNIAETRAILTNALAFLSDISASRLAESKLKNEGC